MHRPRLLSLLLVVVVFCGCWSCHRAQQNKIVVGSKFFTEQVILAELVAQQVEAHTGIHVERKTNLGGTLLVQKALLAGELDLYVEYTGTALTAVLGQTLEPAEPNETAARYSRAVYDRVKKGYSDRFRFEVTEPLGFENTFAMVIRGDDAKQLNLKTMSDLLPIAPRWRIAVGYEFLERPDGFPGWSKKYNLQFKEKPRVMDLGLLYRSLIDRQVDIVAGNSTDGLINALNLKPLQDDLHYFPPYDAVPVVRQDTLLRFPRVREALAQLAGKVSADDIRRMNYAVDGALQDPEKVVREFRASRGL